MTDKFSAMREPGMSLSADGLGLLKRLEGAKRRRGRHIPYRDQAGKLTVGYGHLIKPGEKFPASGITEAEATAILAQDVAWAERAVDEHVDVPLSQSQYDSLVCFVFNIGEPGFKRSTALRKLNAGDYLGCAEALKMWNKITKRVDGKLRKVVSRGLVSRRAQEAALFLSEPPPKPKPPEPSALPWWKRFFTDTRS